MNILFSLILGIVTVLSGYGFYTDQTPVEMVESLGSSMTGSAWFLNASSQIQAGATTWGLRIPFLANCDSIDTNAFGVFSCGTDASGGGGGGGGTTLYVQNGGATLNTGTTTLNFTSNSFELVEDPTDTFSIRVATSTLGLLASSIGDFVANVRTSISETILGLEYNSTTGVFSTTTGYFFPTTTRASTWDTAYSLSHNAVTLAGEDYLSLATQQITANAIDPDNLSASDFGDFTCNGTNCSLDATYLLASALPARDWTKNAALTALTPSTTIGIAIGASSTIDSLTVRNATNTNATSTNLRVSNAFFFGGVAGTAWSDYCVSITGSASLCDGNDASGGAGSSISTSTTPVVGEIAYWTGANTLGTVATGTLTESVLGLDFSASRALIGGALDVSITSGYVMPSTTRETNQDTAVLWGNHALAGYALSTAVPAHDWSQSGGYLVPTTTLGVNLSNHSILSSLSATRSTTTHATTTNLSVVSSLEIFGGGAKTSANALCIQLTGSADLCDGSDGGGSGGGVSDWQQTNLALTPTTTIGIRVNASSTIGDGTATGGLTIAGGATTTGNQYVGGKLTVGTTTSAFPLTIQGAVTSGNFAQFLNVNSGTIGPYFEIFHDSASPSASDSSGIEFTARNSTGGKVVQSALVSEWETTTAGAENGQLGFYITNNGATYNERLYMDSNQFALNRTGNDVDFEIWSSTSQLAQLFDNGANIMHICDDEDCLVKIGTGGLLVGGNSTTTGTASSSALVVSNSVNLFGGGAKTTANALCIQITGSADLCDGSDGGGGGSSKWTDGTNFTYLTNTSYDLAFGSNATETAPFWWDVSATTSYIGNGGAGDSVLTFGPTGSEWTMGFDDTNDAFAISSSTALGSIFYLDLTSTTSTMRHTSSLTSLLPDTGVRFGVGSQEYLGMPQLLDQFVVNGRERNSQWFGVDCSIPVGGTAISADGVTSCDNFSFYEDGTETLTSIAGDGYGYGQLGGSAANGGSGVFVAGASAGWIKLATSTPSMEITARIGAITAAGVASTTQYFIGYSNIASAGTTYETAPTAGCFFTASTTQANWQAICRTALASATRVDTGVPSTTIGAGAGVWDTFRIDADSDNAVFYIKHGDATMHKVADISTTYPSTTFLNAGIHWGRTFGTYAVQFDFFGFDAWFRRFTPNK